LIATVGVNKNLTLLPGVYLNAELSAGAHLLTRCLWVYRNRILRFLAQAKSFRRRTTVFTKSFQIEK
jgi:hypothetical protein